VVGCGRTTAAGLFGSEGDCNCTAKVGGVSFVVMAKALVLAVARRRGNPNWGRPA
jgi:uncharacterized protein (TIGR03382 family)